MICIALIMGCCFTTFCCIYWSIAIFRKKKRRNINNTLDVIKEDKFSSPRNMNGGGNQGEFEHQIVGGGIDFGDNGNQQIMYDEFGNCKPTAGQVPDNFNPFVVPPRDTPTDYETGSESVNNMPWLFGTPMYGK